MFSRFRKLFCLISLIVCDIAALLASFLIAYILRSQVFSPVIPGFKQKTLPFVIQLKYGFFIGALIIIFVFAFEKLYTKRFSFWEETRHLLKGITLSFILIMMMVFISRGYAQFSRVVIIFTWFSSLILFPFFRLMVKKFLVKINLWKKKILILGTNKLAKLITEGIKRNPTLGYEIMGFLGDSRSSVGKVVVDNIRVIGNIEEVEEVSKKLGVHDIVIALPNIAQNKLVELVEKCENVTETIRIVPAMGSLFAIGVEIGSIGDTLSLLVARNLVKPWNIFLKRLFEFIFTLVLIVIFLPILFIMGLAIKVDSPGPIIFTQKRIGKNNNKFNFFKFRSMYVDEDLILNKYLKENPRVHEQWKKYQKIKGGDPRVTRVGKFLRKYSLDELPQLINILKGDMNLVGPRPYLPRETKKIGKSSQIISRVKPGITGLWQVRGRSLLTFKERVLLDEYYIRNWSLWLDIVILVTTTKVFFKRGEAF